MKKKGRFQTPPPTEPIAMRDSSLVFRLSSWFFFRQLSVFLIMDILLALLVIMGLVVYAENRCAGAAALVEQRGVPTPDALVWMQASDYVIEPLDRQPEGYELPAISWLPVPEETAGGLRSWDLSHFYAVEQVSHGQPYAVRVDLSGIFLTLHWGAIALLIGQGLSLFSSLFGNNRTIRKVLRPIQELASTAVRLNSMSHMSRWELENLAGELDKINATHLDSRIDLPATQKELRSLAQAINEMLDRVNRAYNTQMRFVSDASHELRTPIAVIQGYASLLDRWGKSDPEALQESINAIRAETAAMEQLVEQLLFLARGDNESQPVKKELLDLTLVAGEVLREAEMLHPQRAFLSCWEDEVRVWADPGLIKQVMRILMDNSIKYSPDTGKVYLRVSHSQGHARVTVQDEGMGIAPEGIPHIFTRFYRTDRSRDRKTGGTGLGLSIAEWIVQHHSGWFEVVSRQDVGTRFTFVIPLVNEDGQEHSCG